MAKASPQTSRVSWLHKFELLESPRFHGFACCIIRVVAASPLESGYNASIRQAVMKSGDSRRMEYAREQFLFTTPNIATSASRCGCCSALIALNFIKGFQAFADRFGDWPSLHDATVGQLTFEAETLLDRARDR